MLLHLPKNSIEVTIPWWGLGALITATTSHLLRFRGTPTIGWWSHWYTREARPITNIYEWFYDQPATINHHYQWRDWDMTLLNANCQRSVELVKRARERWRDVVGGRLDKPGCYQAALQTFATVKQAGVLGVHYRGTDKRSEVMSPPIEALLDNIKEIQVATGLQTVLVCTDDQNFLTACQQNFENLIYFKDHLRVSGARGLHVEHGSYRQCVETMIEILALGLCDHLYLGRSCVADAALFWSRDDLTWEYYN